MSSNLTRKAAAEFLGTGFLVAVVVGSGIATSRLSPNDHLLPATFTEPTGTTR